MAIVTVPAEFKTLLATEEVAAYLSSLGIDYECWTAVQPPPHDAKAEDILARYAIQLEGLKLRGGYVAADVIDINPRTPGLDAMLTKFSREHWHDDDEVRVVVGGRGLFHVRPRGGAVAAIQVGVGDLISVPRGMRHWFNLCADREIRAIRLFRDRAGWTPYYTESRIDVAYQPVCLGPAYLPASRRAPSGR